MDGFKVGTSVTRTGVDLSRVVLWDAQAMAGLCNWSIATIVERTSQQGVGADGRRFRAYSPRPVWVAMARARLKPKGGTLSRTGLSMRFKDYRTYKLLSRKGGIASAEVDLTLSGELLRAIGVASKPTASLGVVTIRGQARSYGTHVNDRRPLMGHHAGEKADMDAEVADLHRDCLRRHTGGRVGPSSKPVL